MNELTIDQMKIRVYNLSVLINQAQAEINQLNQQILEESKKQEPEK